MDKHTKLTATFEHKLSEPVEHFNELIGRIFLMEPRARHLGRYGEPQMAVYTPKTGSSYDIDNEETIGKYLDDLLSLDGREPVDGGGRALFALLSLEDGIVIREALFGFFAKARLRIISARSTS